MSNIIVILYIQVRLFKNNVGFFLRTLKLTQKQLIKFIANLKGSKKRVLKNLLFLSCLLFFLFILLNLINYFYLFFFLYSLKSLHFSLGFHLFIVMRKKRIRRGWRKLLNFPKRTLRMVSGMESEEEKKGK